MNGDTARDRRLDRLAEIQGLRAVLDAEEQRLLAALAADPAPFPSRAEAIEKEWVREEIACLLHLAPVTAGRRLHTATELVHRLPDTLAALERGAISVLHARSLVDAVRDLDDATVTAVQARVLARAENKTVGEFRRHVTRAVHSLDPRGSEARRQDALAQCRVVFTPQDDGVTELWALLPADGAEKLRRRVEHDAEHLKGLDDRSADQRRVDALVSLAGASTTSGPSGPAVQVTVAASTLLGLDEEPGELAGYGPITATLARAIATDPTATWRRILTDHTGQVLDYGRRTYRPPANLDRHVRARDRTCRFPGCTRRAGRTELDHITAWADGGETNADNLHCLCPRHHHLKHEAGWTVQRQPDGTTRWRTPDDRYYDNPPHWH